jgi:hypothetical protein
VATILVVTSPVDQPTRYAYHYWKRYARTPAQNGHEVIILKNTSLATFKTVLAQYNPNLVILDGHGGSKGVEINKHVILGVEGYDPELGLTIHGTNTHLMEGRMVYCATCNTGKELAFRLIDAGAVAVAAYREPFIFLSEEHAQNPLRDKIAYPFFISLLQPALLLATGKTFGEAVVLTREAFQYYCSVAEANGDEQSAKYLHFDSVNFIGLGDMWARL